MKNNSYFDNAQDLVLKRTFEIFPDPISIHSEGIIKYVNEACVNLLEAESKEEIIGKPTLSFVHNSYKTFVEERIRLLRKGEILKDLVEEIFITLKGNKIYVEVAAAPIIFEGKDSILVIFRDITERKKEEERLMHMDSLLQAIHNINQTLLKEKKEEKLLKDICENLGKVKGYSFVRFSKVIGNKIFSHIGCKDEEFEKKIKKIKEKIPENILLKKEKIIYGKIPYKYDEFKEWNKICKDFSFKSFCFIPIKVRKKIWGILSLYSTEKEFFDKEERALLQEIASQIGMAIYSSELKKDEKKAKKELKISEEKMKTLLNSLEDSVFSLDRKGRFKFFHSKIKDYPFSSGNQLLGKNFKEIFPEDFASKLEEVFKNTLLGETKEFECWYPLNEKTLWFSVKLSPLYYKENIKEIVAVARDITEKIMLEAEKINNLYKIQSTLESTVMALASAVELRDATTYGHQARTAKLACAIAKRLGLSKDKIEGLRIAAHIHDVGKIGIPAEILAKPGKLLPIELELIKTHAQKGFELLKGIEFPWPVSQIVLQHSEHIDGSGYPQGLKEEEILEEAKILAVADAIDAMLSHRPYRPALPVSEVIKQIKGLSGRWYDKKVVDIAVELLESGFKWF